MHAYKIMDMYNPLTLKTSFRCILSVYLMYTWFFLNSLPTLIFFLIYYFVTVTPSEHGVILLHVRLRIIKIYIK